MRSKIHSKANFKFDFKNHGTVVNHDLPSLTVPDQTLSMRELIERHTRGLDVRQYTHVYDSQLDGDYPEISKMDKIERLQFMEQNAYHINQTKKTLQKVKKHNAQIKNRVEAEKAAELAKSATDNEAQTNVVR